MTSSRPLVVLQRFRMLAKYSFLHNEQGLRIGRYRIPDMLIFGSIAIPTISCSILSFMPCFEGHFVLKDMALPLLSGTAFLQLTLMHMALGKNKKIAVQTLDYLQEVVNSRMYSIRRETHLSSMADYIRWVIRLQNLFDSPFVGCAKSQAAYELYAEMETKSKQATRYLFVFYFSVIAALFPSAFFTPICNALTGWPARETWVPILPLK